jgi:hypothetical protein
VEINSVSTNISRSSGSPFLSPNTRGGSQKKIILLAESITGEIRSMIQRIFSRPILEEISYEEADEMLLRSTDASVTASVPCIAMAIEEPK